MSLIPLFNNDKKDASTVAENLNIQFSVKSDIRNGMTSNEIAKFISDQLIAHVDKALNQVKK